MIAQAMETTAIYPSPVGDLLLTQDGTELTGLTFLDDTNSPSCIAARLNREAGPTCESEPLAELMQQLDEYFAGRRRTFEFRSLSIRLTGTDFQMRVWQELCRIPYGQTISYGELAKRIGQPSASRAVGLANGRNPISILVPCHRVIGATGKLVGYGGGLDRKQKLLEIEAAAP